MNNTSSTSIGLRIHELKLQSGIRVQLLNNGTPDVIAISGSFLGGNVFAPENNPELPSMLAAMLTRGTKTRTKKQIDEALESIGATINFKSSAFKFYFTVTCLIDTFEETLEIFTDLLLNSTFPAGELENLKKQAISMVEESRENTRSQANQELTRALFPKNHPYRYSTPDEEIAYINNTTSESLRAYCDKNFDFSSLLISIVGDADLRIQEQLEKYFNKSQLKKLNIPPVPNPSKQKSEVKIVVPISGKANADLVIGQNIPLNRLDQEFIPLSIAIQIFGGGGFTARLMNEVREKRGLTYGVNASLQGVSMYSTCYLQIWGTFAPKVVSAGKKVILDQYKLLINKGISKKELSEIKTELIGSYQVSLESTTRMAGLLLTNMELGKDKGYIDEYQKIISEVTLAEVNGVIRKYLSPKNLVQIVAGSVEKSALN